MSDFLFIYGCRERLSALFQCLQTKKNLSLLYSDFIPFSQKLISDFIPFYDKTISDFIPFYSFSVDKYKKTEYNIGNKT